MKNPLNIFANNITSQFGEDGIINRIFEILPQNENKWCVEFGAWDGKHLSNTYQLLNSQNWNGILIEGSKKKFIDLKQNHQNNPKVILVNKFGSTLYRVGNQILVYLLRNKSW